MTEYGNAPCRPQQQPAPRQPSQQQPGSAQTDAEPHQPVIIVRRPETQAQAPAANQQQNPIQAPIFNNQASPQPIIINNAGAAAAPAPQPIIINTPGYGPGGWQQQGPGPGYGGYDNNYAVVTRRTLQTYADQGYPQPGYDPNAYAQPPYDPNAYAQPGYDPYAGYGYDAAAYGQGFDPAITRINPANGQPQAPTAPKKSAWSPLRIISGLVMVGGAFTFGVAALGLASNGAPINAFGIAPAPWGNWSDINGAWAPLVFGAGTAIAGGGFMGFRKKPA